MKISDLRGSGARKAVDFFDENPTFILASCSTGAKEGIAQELSSVFHAKVIAPENPTSVLGYFMRASAGDKVNLDLMRDTAKKTQRMFT